MNGNQVRPMLAANEIEHALERLQTLRRETGRVFIGQEDVVAFVLCGILSGGHVLLDGVPGLGKTLLVKSLAVSLGCQFNRIQFTPDLMPADITGTHIYNAEKQKFVFYRGPVFTQFLLADEINRSPAKTHSALLEIMQERSVTLDGTRYPVDEPFFVVATQNPIESEGTYGLPEAQLDRFMLKLHIHYPRREDELHVYRMHLQGGEPDPSRLSPVLGADGIRELRGLAERVFVSDAVLHYVHRLIESTRTRRDLAVACSPRAALSVLRGSRVLALLHGRGYVLPDDIKELAPPAFRHRIRLQPEAYLEGMKPDDIIADILNSVEVPERDFTA